MLIRSSLVVAAIALFGCSPVLAQGRALAPAAEGAIVRAVAEYMMAKVASRNAHVDREVDIVLDRAILPSGDADRGATWPAALLEDIVTHAGARVGSLRDYHSCPQDAPPGHCYLEGADVVVNLGRPDVDGNRGTILVREVARASGDIDSPRAYRSSALLKIESVDGRWQVVGVDFVSVSD